LPLSDASHRLTGHDIIYLAGHDFSLADSRISTDHLAQELARHNRVLYVESVGLRQPRLDANDLSRIRRKLARFLQPPRLAAPQLWVLTPLAIPLHGNALAQSVNERLLAAQIRRGARRLRFTDPILFVFLPSMAGAVGRVGERLSVYYCTDEHSAFPGVDVASVKRAEQTLLRKVDVAFATSRELVNAKSQYHPFVHYSPHGVDFPHFAQAQNPDLAPADEVASLRRPIVGYFGAIDRWLDLPLIIALARERPQYSFVLIGKPAVDIAAAAALPNVHILGQRPFDVLPRYGRAFDVAIVPFVINELTIHVSPIKLREYLAMGKAVVSTPLPAVVEFARQTDVVEVASDSAAFLAALDRAIANDSADRIRARQAAVQHDTWEARAADVEQVIEAALRRRYEPRIDS
jgi:glycosyltransferase involved in cell wall biosynthesis